MRHTEFQFKGANSSVLYSQSWEPDDQPGALMVIVHGIGDHSGRYMNVVRHLVAERISVYSFDLRGHGKSPGQLGHISCWAEYRKDLSCFIDTVSAGQPDLPIILFGHSMGALIALDFMLSDGQKLTAAVISGAPIEPSGVTRPLKVALAKLLSRLYPRFPIDLGLEVEAISRDPSAVRSYKDDPLVHGRVSARWGAELLSTLESVKRRGGEISTPFLMVHGEADRMNSSEGAKRFFDNVALIDKEFRVYPGGYHELHNDLCSNEMLLDVSNWINRHI